VSDPQMHEPGTFSERARSMRIARKPVPESPTGPPRAAILVTTRSETRGTRERCPCTMSARPPTIGATSSAIRSTGISPSASTVTTMSPEAAANPRLMAPT
jgi:hypothetical protein